MALATADAGPALRVLVGDLGGTVLSGGQAHGFRPVQVRVDDFDAALDAVAASGRTPVGINRDDPNWMEAFVAPAEAFGTVVQLAAQAVTYDFPARFAAAVDGGPIADPAWWPALPAPDGRVAVLERVVLRTADLDGAVDFFGGLLEGTPEHATRDRIDLVWPGGGRLRLEAHEGPAGIDRLELAGPAPARVLAGTPVVGA